MNNPHPSFTKHPTIKKKEEFKKDKFLFSFFFFKYYIKCKPFRPKEGVFFPPLKETPTMMRSEDGSREASISRIFSI